MKRINKLISLLLVAAMLLATVSASASASASDTVILYTNDVHCAIDNYDVFAAYGVNLESGGDTVINVDAGDAIQGEVIGLLTEGETIVEIMNEVGYDIAIPGNHEFDYGVDRFLEIAEKEADYEYISSNFYHLSEDRPCFKPYIIKEGENGEKIAFVGISTPETFTKTSPEYFMDESGNYVYGFPTYPEDMTNEKLYENVQESVDKAISEGADIVIALGHLGIIETTEGWKSTDVIANTDGVDYFIDAHSEEVIEKAVYKNKNNEDVILTSSGRKFANFGAITITAAGEVTVELINPAEVDVDSMSESAKTAYADVKAVIDEANAEIAYLYDPICTSEAELVTADEEGRWIVRLGETNMGDLVADAYRAVGGADIGLANGGSVRSKIKVGDIARIDLMNVNPFGNEICVAKVTGQQILDALEHGARALPEATGGFLQVSEGLTFEIDMYKESPVIVDGVDNFIEIDETKERRVKNVKFNGDPIDPDGEYLIAGTRYLIEQNGDGYTMFKGAQVTPLNMTDGESVVKYFTENLKGKITAEKYGNPEGSGRIIINTEPAEPCAHICHDDGILGFFWSIAAFFIRLFGIEDFCECGIQH